jgi:hypothetical protein
MLVKTSSYWVAAILACLLAGPSAFAQAPQAQRLAGTIVSVDGPAVMLKTKTGDGEGKSHRQGDGPAVEKVKMDGIKAGEFVGVGAMPQADGTQRAVRINIFDEARRGNGEGFRPDYGPDGSTMTNATVDTTVGGIDGQVLMLKYKDGEKKIIVPPETIISAIWPAAWPI